MMIGEFVSPHPASLLFGHLPPGEGVRLCKFPQNIRRT